MGLGDLLVGVEEHREFRFVGLVVMVSVPFSLDVAYAVSTAFSCSAESWAPSRTRARWARCWLI